MTTRSRDPRRLDIAAAAADGARLSGQWPLAGLARLCEGGSFAGDLPWSAAFELRPPRAGAPEVWVHLFARAAITRECQRCLQPVALDLTVDRWFRFVADEATAAALDADSEDDVLVLSRHFDLAELIEDELLLALPLVPKHEPCPQAPTAIVDDADVDVAPHPFAALAALKQRQGH